MRNSDPWAPRLVGVEKPKAAPAPIAPTLQSRIEQVIVKETTPVRGWRFVPHRDENDRIIEIIATPIE